MISKSTPRINFFFKRGVEEIFENRTPKKKAIISDVDGKRHTKSVAQLVALAFVEAPTGLCDQVVVLDGDHRNTAAYNLAWRPAWFAWKYSRQLKTLQPAQFENLTIRCVNNGAIYSSVVDAGMKEGLLFQDVWRSTFTRAEIFPGGLVFEVVRKSIGD